MADDDAAWIVAGVLFVAAALTLAAHGGSTSSGSGSGSSTSHTTSTAALTASTTTPRCTFVATRKSSSGGSYMQYPISSAGSSHCYLQQGNTGLPVATLQRAMTLCMRHSLQADGVYGAHTANAVGEVGKSGPVYGPVTAGRMLWPWYGSSTNKVTGRCSAA